MKKLHLLISSGLMAASLFGVVTLAAADGFSTSPLPEGQSATFPLAPLSITENSSLTLIAGNSVSCNDGFGHHTNNSYLRRFDLDGAFGIVGAFNVTSVDIGVELSIPGGVSQPVTVNLYKIPTASPLTIANLTIVGTATVNVGQLQMGMINVPVAGLIASPAASDLVVEVFTPDGRPAGNVFFIGSNNLPETAPSYLAAADCGVPNPLTTAAIGFPGMHIVMVVNGNETPVPTTTMTLGKIKAMYR